VTAKQIPEGVIKALRGVVDRKGWIDDESGMEPHLIEARGLWRGTCTAVVRPASTEETAQVIGICAAAGVPVTPQGGNTGLLGGAVPNGGIVLSMARMNRIRAVDPLNLTMTVEAGCVLATIQDAAAEAACLFPLSLAAEGSCQIGGNLSTNAGGVQVLRYGNARDLVLGLEVVLADGRVWEGLRGLRKDNTGYDLKHLFIGAEGTLGIITAAVLKLYPQQPSRETVMAAVGDVDAALALFSRICDSYGDALTAFELIPRLGMEFAAKHMTGVVDPFQNAHPFYALIELTSPEGGAGLRGALELLLSQALNDDIADDAVIASSEAQREELWRVREVLSECQKFEGGSIKHDVSVPISRVPEFIRRAGVAVETAMPGVRILAFGHVGDGNIHYNLSQPVGADTDAFLARWDESNRIIHDLANEMDGSFSAEHGIGILKRGELLRYKSAVEVDLMRTLKRAMDPKNIMNPGKVL
jgi:FAD/FMN-containing dehydrogenase